MPERAAGGALARLTAGHTINMEQNPCPRPKSYLQQKSRSRRIAFVKHGKCESAAAHHAVRRSSLHRPPAKLAIRLGFHDAGTWSSKLAASGQDFGGADGSIALAPAEIKRAENNGLQDIVKQMQIWQKNGVGSHSSRPASGLARPSQILSISR